MARTARGKSEQREAQQTSLSALDSAPAKSRARARGSATVDLTRERERLLREIGRRKKELARATKQTRETLALLVQRLRPLLLKRKELEEEVHRHFAELLRRGRLPGPKRRRVSNFYRELHALGLIELRDANFEGVEKPESNTAGQASVADFSPREVSSAAVAPDDKPSLRALFKRLAVHLHPDRVQGEADKELRTEQMKKVTHAYRAGDFARLLELEKAWISETYPASADHEGEHSSATLARAVKELKAQLRSVLDDLRKLRRSEEFRTAHEFRRHAAIASDASAMFIKDAERELWLLMKVRDLASGFAKGTFSWEQFLSGSAWLREHASGDLPVEALEQVQLIETPGSEAARKAP